MERLRQELDVWMREQFPGALVALEPVRRGVKLSGILAWDGFDGLEPIDRQLLLWRKLRERFGRDDQLRISMLITLSPAEYAVYSREQARDREPIPA